MIKNIINKLLIKKKEVYSYNIPKKIVQEIMYLMNCKYEFCEASILPEILLEYTENQRQEINNDCLELVISIYKYSKFKEQDIYNTYMDRIDPIFTNKINKKGVVKYDK